MFIFCLLLADFLVLCWFVPSLVCHVWCAFTHTHTDLYWYHSQASQWPLLAMYADCISYLQKGAYYLLFASEIIFAHDEGLFLCRPAFLVILMGAFILQRRKHPTKRRKYQAKWADNSRSGICFDERRFSQKGKQHQTTYIPF